MLAVVRFGVCLFHASWAPPVLSFLSAFVNHCCRHDACRNSDDGVAENHDNARQDAAYVSDRGDVAVADSGEGDDGPVDAGADVGEVCVRLSAFNHEHECAENSYQYQHKEKVNGYFLQAQAYTLHKQIPFVDETEKLEHTENAYEAECSQNKEVACAGHARYEREIEWECGQQIDDAEKAECVVFGLGRTVDAQYIFHREEECQHIFQHGEYVFEASCNGWERFDKSNQQAENNGNHDGYVECLSCTGV